MTNCSKSSQNHLFDYSIVATTFNDEKNIERFIRDITNQTFLPREIVIADGGSKDHTIQILQAISNNSKVPIKVLYGKRLNIAEGYNEAIKATTEKYIGISGVGNRYSKDYYEKLILRMTEKRLDGVYSPIRGLDTTPFSKCYNNQLLNGEYGQRLEIASNHGALLKKDVYISLNYFYEKFVYAGEDTEFYSLVKNNGYKLELVPDAYVRWETPESYSEFKKQVKVYSIAGLQIDSVSQIKMVLNSMVKLGIIILSFIALLWMFFLSIDSIIKMCIFFLAITFFYLFRVKLRPLKLLQMILQIYYTLTNLKYGKDDYKVRR